MSFVLQMVPFLTKPSEYGLIIKLNKSLNMKGLTEVSDTALQSQGTVTL